MLFTTSRIVRESFPVLVAMLAFSLFTGRNLEASGDLIVSELPFIILTIPAFINMAGDLADVFTARITSCLFVGSISTRFRPRSLLTANYFGTLTVALLGFVFLGTMIAIVNQFILGHTLDYLRVVASIVLSGMATTVMMSLLGLGAAYVSFSRGLNPDNFTPPLTTTLGDAVGTLLLLSTVRLLLV